MKKITITLLTLLILGGCSQEPTELERCIEANLVDDRYTYKPTFDLSLIRVIAISDMKYATEQYACLNEDPLAMEYRKQYSEIDDQERKKEVSGITDKEAKDFDKQREKIDDKYLSGLKRSWKNCENIYKRRATKICHAQGIY